MTSRSLPQYVVAVELLHSAEFLHFGFLSRQITSAALDVAREAHGALEILVQKYPPSPHRPGVYHASFHPCVLLAEIRETLGKVSAVLSVPLIW